jgi:hypothetical protein
VLNFRVVRRVIFQLGSRISEEAMTANQESKQKHKRPEKHAQEADLGQKKARLEKEKEAQISAMGQAPQGSKPHQRGEGGQD